MSDDYFTTELNLAPTDNTVAVNDDAFSTSGRQDDYYSTSGFDTLSTTDDYTYADMADAPPASGFGTEFDYGFFDAGSRTEEISVASFDKMSYFILEPTSNTRGAGFGNSIFNAFGSGGTKTANPFDAADAALIQDAYNKGELEKVSGGYVPKDQVTADLLETRRALSRERLEQQYGERKFTDDVKKQDNEMRSFEKAQIWMMLGMVALQFYMRKDDREYAEATYQKRREESRDDALWQRDVLFGSSGGGGGGAATTSGGVRSGVQWL